MCNTGTTCQQHSCIQADNNWQSQKVAELLIYFISKYKLTKENKSNVKGTVETVDMKTITPWQLTTSDSITNVTFSLILQPRSSSWEWGMWTANTWFRRSWCPRERKHKVAKNARAGRVKAFFNSRVLRRYGRRTESIWAASNSWAHSSERRCLHQSPAANRRMLLSGQPDMSSSTHPCSLIYCQTAHLLIFREPLRNTLDPAWINKSMQTLGRK